MSDCQSMWSDLSKLWEQYSKIVKMVGVAVNPEAVVAIEIAEKFGKAWNDVFGNGVLHIGPRYLGVGDTLKGDVLAGTQRQFAVAPVPHNARITFKKVGGEAAGTVTFCGFDKAGKHSRIAQFNLSKDTPDDKTFDAVLPANLAGAVIVHSDSVFKQLQYTLRHAFA
jgi:hypothetical protein